MVSFAKKDHEKHAAHVFSLPLASAVEVIESEPCVCLSALSPPNHLTSMTLIFSMELDLDLS